MQDRIVTFGDGNEYQLDRHGFLDPPDQWTEGFAEGMAKTQGIHDGLTDEHWKIIDFVRKYYRERGEGPPVVKIGRDLGMKSSKICTLFPCGAARGAYRLAGLPRPAGCV